MPRPQKFSTPLKQIPFRVPEKVITAIKAEADKAGKNRTDFILDALRSQFKSIDKACK